MRTVGVLEAKTHLSSLLDSVEREKQEIAITRHGRVVARLLPPMFEPPPARKLSGAELLARSRSLRDQVAREFPDDPPMSWEELKEIARR